MEIANEKKNPLEEFIHARGALEPCVLVIFGATGDLVSRKLIPSLYRLALKGQLPLNFACVGFARRDKTHEDFRLEMLQALNAHSYSSPIDQNIWKTFKEQLFYHRSEFDNDNGYESLSEFLCTIDKKLGTKGNRVFYLSTPPSYFPLIVEKLHLHKLLCNARNMQKELSKVIIEKPFGKDLPSAIHLNGHLLKYLREEQIYRIDHYLGKETVQNLLVFRFSNSIFESIWNNKNIDHIQITVCEDLGVGTRGLFFEETGLLRDIVQNHLMQLLCLVAMEPPVSLSADDIRDEKVKVLRSARDIYAQASPQNVIRAQYGPGYIDSKPVPGYLEENNVSPNSLTETFVALKFHIDNWRWGGVPFYLRAGKRLPKKSTEIAIYFKDVPSPLFSHNSGCRKNSNVLIIRIQPDAGISLKINCKVPNMNNVIQPVKMDFHYGSTFGITPPNAYERLLLDCFASDSTLFTRGDEVMEAWRLIHPILEKWKSETLTTLPMYPAGTWGSEIADKILSENDRTWRNL